MDAEKLAHLFHNAYEHLAPEYGYETRKESAVPWAEVPEKQKNLMIATARKVLEAIANEMVEAGTWTPPGHAIKPMIIPPSMNNEGKTVSGRVTVSWPPLPSIGEIHAKVMINEAIAAAEDRIIERVFKMLSDRLSIQRATGIEL